MLHSHDDWQMIPLGGSTGQAFIGLREGERVFLKRNGSPFITALAAMGFAPKLIWSQRSYSGDVLIAQEWMEGSLMTPKNMRDDSVIHLIRRLHESSYLYDLLKQMQAPIYRPEHFIQDYLHQLPSSLQSHRFLNEVLHYLSTHYEEHFLSTPYCVCHGDLHHLNFLMDTTGKLFLVDWENVRLADPISDLTQLLCHYFPPSQWQIWLDSYGMTYDSPTLNRIRWYSLMNALLSIKHHYRTNNHTKMNEMILLLRSIYQQIPNTK